MTPPVPAEAVARLTKYLDAVDESHRSPFQKSVSYTDHDAGTFAWEVFKVSDLRALLAAYADAARDRERMAAENEALRIGLRLRDEEAPEVRGRRISVSALFSELELRLAAFPRELVASRIHAQVDAMLDSMLPTEPRALPAARTGEAR